MQEAGLEAAMTQRPSGGGVEVTVRVSPRRRSRKQQLHGEVVMPVLEALSHPPESEG